MNEIERITAQVVSGYRDGAWPGVSVRELLRSLSPTEAAAHPVASVHSAWEIALHLGVWRDVIRRRLGGEAIDYQHDEDWPQPAEPTEANWQALLEELDRGHRELVETVRRLPLAKLDETVPGKPFNVYFMLHGVAQHDLYHGGQVMLLRKALRAATPGTA